MRIAMKKAFRAVGSRRKISQKIEDLAEYQKVLDTRILGYSQGSISNQPKLLKLLTH